jgi:MFS family permease
LWVIASLVIPLLEWLPPASRSVGLLITWSCAWVGAGLYGVNRAPYLTALTSPHARTHIFALSRAATGAAAVIGSLFAGFLPGLIAGRLQVSLDTSAPYRYALLLPPLLYLAILPSLHSLQEVEMARSNQLGEAARPPVMLMAAVAFFLSLVIASQAAASTFFNVYMDSSLGVPTATIGILIAAGQVLSIATALGAPLLNVRWGNFRTVVGGALGAALGVAILALSSHWLAAGLGYIIVMLLSGLLEPLKTVLHQEVVAPEWRSPMAGMVNMAEKVGRATVLGAGGFLVVWMGYQSMFMGAALLTLAGAFFLWRYICYTVRGATTTPRNGLQVEHQLGKRT